MTNKRAPFASAIAAIVLAAGAVSPALAGPTEVALLSNYIGEWSGAGVLQGGDSPEPFTCRLTIDKGNQAKINYAGRCTLVNMNLSVSGTIAYDDASRTYQAIMGSNAGFKGVAIGRVKGKILAGPASVTTKSIGFDIPITITYEHIRDVIAAGLYIVFLGAQIVLINNTSITVNYQVEFNDSGRVLTATVPFAK